MIQNVNILTVDGKSLIFRQYGASKIDQDLLAGFLSAFSGFMMEISQSEIKSTITGNSKFVYSIEDKIIVVVSTDVDDKDEEIHPKVESIMSNFQKKYGELFSKGLWTGERNIFQEFVEYIDKIVLGPIKISIMGYGGVGKSTLLRLIVGREVNLEYVPTITADIATSDAFGKRNVVLWDFAGQIQFTDLWNSLLKGTRIVLLVTDSTYSNVQESKKILTNLIDKYYKDTKVIGIANKQDLPKAMSAPLVKKVLGVDEVYGICAIDPSERRKLQNVIAHGIEQYLAKEAEKEKIQ